MQIWSFWHNAQFIELGDLSESCVQVSLEPITENCWFRRAAACCELTEKKNFVYFKLVWHLIVKRDLVLTSSQMISKKSLLS